MKREEDFLNLVKACSRKDKAAWDNFVKRYSNLVYLYILKTLRRYNFACKDGDLVDIFDSVFLALLENDCRRLKNFRGSSERSFLAYMREIIFHITVDFLRNQVGFVNIENIQNYISEDSDFRKLDYIDLRGIMEVLIAGLPQRQRLLFKLLYDEELRTSEIAQIMSVNLNALNQLKFRMIKNIIRIARKKDLYCELRMFTERPCSSVRKDLKPARH